MFGPCPKYNVSRMGNGHDEMDELRRRLDLLERDNQRLREKLDPMFGPDNPCFDPKLFMRSLQKLLMTLMIPIIILTVLVPVLAVPLAFGSSRGLGSLIPHWSIGPIPFLDMAGSGCGVPGIGLGIIAIGGGAVGAIAIGGMAIGLVAIGGCAVGVIALGGGSFGLIAVGGGACGWIAIGGGAVGRYALAQRAAGKYVLALNRQDPQVSSPHSCPRFEH